MRDRRGKDRTDTQSGPGDLDAADQALGDAYEAAWDEWIEGEGAVWDVTVGDGLSAEDWSSERTGDADTGARQRPGLRRLIAPLAT